MVNGKYSADGGAGEAGSHVGDNTTINARPYTVDTSADILYPGFQQSYSTTQPLPKANWYGKLMYGLGSVIGTISAIPCCSCLPVNFYRDVDQGFVGLVSRFGKYYKTVDPGLVSVNPLSESIKYVDMRIRLSTLDRIAIMTMDNVNILIDAVIYWHVINPYIATFGVANPHTALIERTQTTLRTTLGARVLQDIIETRETIVNTIREIIDGPAHSWGIKVETILIKDLQFSQELQTSLASAATQKRIGQSKVIAAKAEVEAAKLMREAADLLNTPAAMQIRYLETMADMAKNNGVKTIFMPALPSYGQEKALGRDIQLGEASRILSPAIYASVAES